MYHHSCYPQLTTTAKKITTTNSPSAQNNTDPTHITTENILRTLSFNSVTLLPFAILNPSHSISTHQFLDELTKYKLRLFNDTLSNDDTAQSYIKQRDDQDFEKKILQLCRELSYKLTHDYDKLTLWQNHVRQLLRNIYENIILQQQSTTILPQESEKHQFDDEVEHIQHCVKILQEIEGLVIQQQVWVNTYQQSFEQITILSEETFAEIQTDLIAKSQPEHEFYQKISQIYQDIITLPEHTLPIFITSTRKITSIYDDIEPTHQ
jgi:hypothetical protein